ncbi:MAG: glutamate--tRNA ligase [Candidatus Pacebacteria bacterium]|nr:glutamate--tRNA ligase [Candidatus Paceibacterota bacterium]
MTTLNEKENVRVRFAPSPTGLFHVGSARVALFNYLFVKKNNGKFILRIEDTDKIRSTKESEEDIMSGLKWLGFEFDEFYKQSEREDTYKKYIEKLIKEDKAYVSKEEVKEEGQRSEVIRFRNPNKKVKFNDLIRGEIEFDTTELGDFVIAKGFDEPIFHLVVVIDDFEMGITHIIRGEDHISNTPRHILIQEAIGAPVPSYAHLPLMLAEDRAKLSKRKHGEMTSVKFYQKKGYLPEAFVNFLAFVGWNPGTEKEIFSLDELINDFDLSKVQKAGAIFNPQKLLWYNKEYLKKLPIEKVEEEIKNRLPKTSEYQNDILLKKVSPIILERINVWSDIDDMVANNDIQYLFIDPEVDTDMVVWKKGGTKEEAKNNLQLVSELINNISDDKFNLDNIKEGLMKLAEEKGRGNVLWPLRVSLSGKEKSPDPFTLVSVLGKEVSLRRIESVISKL